MEFVATLARHTATVNCVRWHPKGGLLASGGDDGSILIWQQSDRKQDSSSLDDDDEGSETWRVVSLLRGTTSDLYDLAWSPDAKFIISACIDNTSRIFNVEESN